MDKAKRIIDAHPNMYPHMNYITDKVAFYNDINKSIEFCVYVFLNLFRKIINQELTREMSHLVACYVNHEPLADAQKEYLMDNFEEILDEYDLTIEPLPEQCKILCGSIPIETQIMMCLDKKFSDKFKFVTDYLSMINKEYLITQHMYNIIQTNVNAAQKKRIFNSVHNQILYWFKPIRDH